LAMILAKGDEGVHQKELAEEMRINPSSISELIDKLEADRYIERTVDPADKRATIITLTEKGKARAYEVMDERQATAAEVFRNLSEEEKQTLLVLLDKITADKE
ncbi:MAG: winged helix DNA-binding protein, partial [Solobacterium sp.]|nr:winged helix DNA-binding protein [Solobacterium sp.]